MKYFLICILVLLFTSPTFSKSVNIIEDSEVIFNPFKCNELQTEYLRVNDDSNCVIIQKLSNAFEIKSNDFDKNTWQNPQIIRYLDNKEGKKIIDIDGVRVEDEEGWFLMRASNTQNQLTCRAESISEDGLHKLIAVIENQLSLSGVTYKFTI